MNTYIILGIKIFTAIVLAVIFGNGSVVMFNRIPTHWFEEIGEDGQKSLPPELQDLGDGTRQRLPSTPWKYVFTGYFGIIGIFLALRFSLQYEIAVLFVLAIVLEMAICDGKYRIVPDTFSILLAVSALGFVGFQERWWEPVAGAVTGGFLVLIVYFFGKIIYRKEIIGGADLKFFAALGLIAGSGGIVILFLGTQLLMGVHALTLALRKRLEKNHTLPLIPYGFAALTVYFLFLWDVISFIIF